MSRWPCFLAVSLLCLSHLSDANNRSRQCRCIEDITNHHHGYFLCRSQKLGNVDLESQYLQNEVQCRNISKASLEQNTLTEYPVFLRDRRFKTINLSSNKLRLLPQNGQLSFNVKYLDVSWNKITNSGETLRNVTGLKILLLTGNSLRSLDFLPDPCGLEELDVSGNSIVAVDSSISRCTGLSKLNLAKNRLTSLQREAFGALRYLELLHLGQNPLTSLVDGTFIGLSYLRRLSLTNTGISEIRKTAFTGLTRLDYLDLSGNNIDWLPSDAFREVPNISTLILDGNQLSELPDRLLSSHFQLRHLLLRNNHFRSLPIWIILEDRPSLMTVDLNDNSIQPRLLGWTLARDDLQRNVDTELCNCGFIARQNVNVRFCMIASCGSEMQNANWMDLVISSGGDVDVNGDEDAINNL